MIGYLNGQYAPNEEIKISPQDRGFQFADGVYEVIRSYGGHLFELDAHMKRLERSLREMKLNFADVEGLKGVCRKLIQDNELSGGDALVYIQITRGAHPRDHGYPSADVAPTVYAVSRSYTPHVKEKVEGIRVVLLPDIRWARCDVKTVALLPNVMAHQQALDAGAHEAVLVRDGIVTEGTRFNVFGVFDGTVMTAPKTNYILPGITRDVVLRLCGEKGIPVNEYPMSITQLREAEELIAVGTGTEVTPIVRVDDWTVAEGRAGPITRRLQQALDDVIEKLVSG